MDRITLMSRRRRLALDQAAAATTSASITPADMELIKEEVQNDLLAKGLAHPHHNKAILDGLNVDQNNVGYFNNTALSTPLISDVW